MPRYHLANRIQCDVINACTPNYDQDAYNSHFYYSLEKVHYGLSRYHVSRAYM